MDITVNDATEMTLRADVDGNDLQKVRLPSAVELTAGEAVKVAVWAKPFAGTAMTDFDIFVTDIRPSAAVMSLGDLGKPLAEKIQEICRAAQRSGFGMRLTRDDPTSPYALSVFRRVIDAPMLTISFRSLRNFLTVITPVDTDLRSGQFHIDGFEAALKRTAQACMDAGVAHYHAYSQRILDYGREHGATRVVWGPERRGMGN